MNTGRLIIFALGISPPGTMGGNSKITIEMIRELYPKRELVVIVSDEKVQTLTDASLNLSHGLCVVPRFPGNDKFHPIQCIRHFSPIIEKLFKQLNVCSKDIVFGCSDFHNDVVPLFKLQRQFGFRWLPSIFLFIPSVWENITEGYRFPVIKYAIYRVYQWLLCRMMFTRGIGAVITNVCDQGKLPRRLARNSFPFYGGVNVEQIPTGEVAKTRDVVFCSRLHPQKGVSGLLEIWAKVLTHCPTAILTLIGNGAPDYESQLHALAQRLGIAHSLQWLGYVNNAEKYHIYLEAKVFVHATVFDNNGMVAAEALCSGLPVVMFDLPALREVYTEGCTKVPPRDQEAFAEQIVQLLTDVDYRQRITPTPEQITHLRDKWRWSTRVAAFNTFLDSLPE